MCKRMILVVSLLLISQFGFAQTDSTLAVPTIEVVTSTADIQSAIYPRYYLTHDPEVDIQWVKENSPPVQAFVALHSAEVLSRLSILSGFSWPEEDIELDLVRYFPTPGSSLPLILPLGAIRYADAMVNAPVGEEQTVNLIFQLAKRLLTSGAPEDVADHPLLKKDPYYLDNLAMLLTKNVATEILGNSLVDTTLNAPFWREFWKGRPIYERYLEGEWQISAMRPLLTYLRTEPYDSDLSRAARMASKPTTPSNRPIPQGITPKGRLGLALLDEGGRQLTVSTIDETKLAYLSGLRKGDQLMSINGERPDTIRKAMELLLAKLENGGSIVSLRRDGVMKTLVIRPATGTGQTTPKSN